MSPTYSVCAEHGYLIGEQYKCPICGKVTEVYSRITGYYRPVQNWNDGKSQEYKERKVYNIATSDISKHKKSASALKANLDDFDDLGCGLADGIYLFKTATCPNCKIALAQLAKAGIAVNEVMAYENQELALELGVKQAPTLVVIKDGKAELIPNLSNIKAFAENFSK